MSELENLRQRLRDLIHSQCNTRGCKDCPYKFNLDGIGGECSATDLESKIMDIEMKDMTNG